MARILDGDPYVPTDLLAYLEETYSTTNLLADTARIGRSDSFSLGFIQGVCAVISHMRAIKERSDT